MAHRLSVILVCRFLLNIRQDCEQQVGDPIAYVPSMVWEDAPVIPSNQSHFSEDAKPYNGVSSLPGLA